MGRRRRGIALIAAAMIMACGCGCGRFGFDPLDTHDVEGAPVVAESNLVAWYAMKSLDDAGGGAPDQLLVVDDTGHGHDATCTSTCPRVVPGHWGNGFRFSGAEWMSVAWASDLQTTTGFTIALWFQVASLRAIRGHIVTKGLGTDVQDSWALTLEPDGSFWVFADTFASSYAQPGSRALEIGAWHHLALRWDGSRMESLIDGVIDSTNGVTTTDWDRGAINLGADFEWGAPVAFVDGVLDDVRIYNRALSDAEIGELDD